MKRHSLSSLAVIALVGFTFAAPEPFDPFPRKAEILKIFADEFTPITNTKSRCPGSFSMGSKDADSELPIRTVNFNYAFAMAKNEVTQELYQVVMGKNPSKWKGPRNAVEVVSWQEANDFCGKVTELLHQAKLINAKDKVRLPSEAEWECAARAGTDTKWAFGDDLAQLTHYCWYNANSKGHDPPVGMKKANAWGLYDMHGYNWEWVADDWAPDYKNAPTDGKPFRNDKAKEKVIRGGAWNAPADASRSAFRAHGLADRRDDTLGFRCVLAQE